jgi:hypothetical protein
VSRERRDRLWDHKHPLHPLHLAGLSVRYFTIFGIRIPLTRERPASIVGETVKLKGKPPRTGMVTSSRWRG